MLRQKFFPRLDPDMGGIVDELVDKVPSKSQHETRNRNKRGGSKKNPKQHQDRLPAFGKKVTQGE